MRKFTSFGLALLLTAGLTQAQNKKNVREVTPAQMERHTYDVKFQQQLKKDKFLPTAKQIVPDNFQKPVANPNGINAVSPVELGRASNAFTILRGEQNQVFADQNTSLVAFIHRQDVTIHGGGGVENGKYRYDFSTDGGLVFNNNIGALQTVYFNYGRYPQVTGYNPEGSNNPFDFGLAWQGPTNKFPTPGWIGYADGWSDITTGTVTSTEHYNFDSEPTLLPGGITTGMDGEFWSVDWQFDGTNITDSMYVMKGTYNSTTQDVDWAIHTTLFIPHDKNFDGVPHAVGPNIEFSPDGMTGWIGFLGDLTEAASPSGQDSAAYAPCFIKSTDGGATWGLPIEMNMNNIPWVYDTLRSFWVDSVGDPASDGIATTAFDYDLTVDINGNPHLAAVVGTGGDYSIAATAKFLGDAYSTDGGNTWDLKYIAPVLFLRGEFGVDNGDGLLTMDNFVQTSRTESGSHIFFSWVDSDSTVIGVQAGANSAPNLRIASIRIADWYQTCYKLITDTDILWDGRALYPTLAPTVLVKGGGSNFHLPIVMLDMITGDQLQPCRFWYFGGDAVIYDADYQDPNLLLSAIDWNNGCAVVSSEPAAPATDVVLHQSFPNPTNGSTTIRFDLPNTQSISLELVNMYGQSVGTLAQGNFNAGEHNVEVSTSDLAAGIYFYNLKAGEKVYTKKMIVTK